MVDPIAVGNIISACRRENGMTQDELAAKLGVTPQAVSKWERGASLPDTTMLPDISQFLNVSVDDMLAGRLPSEDTAPTPISKSALSIESAVNLLLPDEIDIRIAADLVEENQEFLDDLLMYISSLRKHLAQNYGLCLPAIRVRDEVLERGEFKIFFRKTQVLSKTAHKSLLYAVSEDPTLKGIPDIDAFGLRIVWMDEVGQRKAGELPLFNCARYVADYLNACILAHPDIIITRQMVKIIVDNLAEKHPILVEEMIPATISYGKLRAVLVHIVKENKPINDMVSILEAIESIAGFMGRPDSLAAQEVMNKLNLVTPDPARY